MGSVFFWFKALGLLSWELGPVLFLSISLPLVSLFYLSFTLPLHLPAPCALITALQTIIIHANLSFCLVWAVESRHSNPGSFSWSPSTLGKWLRPPMCQFLCLLWEWTIQGSVYQHSPVPGSQRADIISSTCGQWMVLLQCLWESFSFQGVFRWYHCLWPRNYHLIVRDLLYLSCYLRGCNCWAANSA